MNRTHFYFLATLSTLFATGWLGLKLAVPPGYASPLWPPAGIGLAALLIGGRKVLPAIWLSSFALNLWLGTSGSEPRWVQVAEVAACIATGSSLQALTAAWLSQRWIQPGVPRLDTPKSIFAFLTLTGPLSCLIAPSLGVASLMALGVMPPQKVFFSWWNWWIGDSLGVIVLTPLVFCLAASPLSVWQPRRLTVALPLVLALTILLVTFLLVFRAEEKNIQMAFDQQASFTGNIIDAGLHNVINSSFALNSHYQTVRIIGRHEFSTFAHSLLNHYPGIQAIEWIPRISQAQREDLEQKARADGFTEFSIIERDATMALIPSQTRTEYFPVYYVEPLTGNENTLGFDLASEPMRCATLNLARSSGHLAVTPRIHLVQNTDRQYGVLLITPVMFQSTNQAAEIKGFTLIVLNISRFVEHTLIGLDNNAFSIVLRDLSATVVDSDLYVGSTNDPPVAKTVLQPWESDLSMGNRTWRIEIRPNVRYVEQHASLLPWLILFIGLLYASLLSSYLLTLTGRAVVIQTIVEERTAQLVVTQAALRQQGEYYQLMMNTSRDAIHILDNQGHLREWNEAFQKHLGYSQDEMLKLHVTDWDNQWDADELLKELENLIQCGATFETRHRCKNGVVRFVEISATGIRIEGIWHLYASARDITERKLMEETLRESEGKFHSLYTTMTEGVALHELIYDAQEFPIDYILLDVNPAFESILSLKRQAVIGRRASDVYGTLTAPNIEIYAQVALTGQSVRFESTFELLGKTFSISAFSPAKHRFATVFEDISKRKRTEIALKKQMDELERFNRAMVGRELQMITLKQEINELCQATGQSVRYIIRTAYTSSEGATLKPTVTKMVITA